MLLLSCAVAQNTAGTATVQSVTTAREGASLRVEITLSAPVKPSVETAVHPDRILLDFPDTTFSDTIKNVRGECERGAPRARPAQHSASPLITRVVLDLDQAHPYTLKTEGNHIVVTVGPVEDRAQRIPRRSSGGDFRQLDRSVSPASRHQRADLRTIRSSLPPPIPPAPANGPAFEPPSDKTSEATTSPVRPWPLFRRVSRPQSPRATLRDRHLSNRIRLQPPSSPERQPTRQRPRHCPPLHRLLPPPPKAMTLRALRSNSCGGSGRCRRAPAITKPASTKTDAVVSAPLSSGSCSGPGHHRRGTDERKSADTAPPYPPPRSRLQKPRP